MIHFGQHTFQMGWFNQPDIDYQQFQVGFPFSIHGCIHTWRIIPVGKCLITMVIVSPLSKVISLPHGRTSWLINGGDPNHLLSGMILQVVQYTSMAVYLSWGIVATLRLRGVVLRWFRCIFSVIDIDVCILDICVEERIPDMVGVSLKQTDRPSKGF